MAEEPRRPGENFWHRLIAELIAAAAPRRMVEIGTESGGHTAMLLDYCRAQGAHLDLPISGRIRASAPCSRATGNEQTYHPLRRAGGDSASGQLRPGNPGYRPELVHDLPRPAIALRRRRERRATCAGSSSCTAPAWPNARRDTYRDPSRIPERHAYAQRGIVPGQELLGDGGVNATCFNALSEGGLLNGVLTAAEDFIASWAEPIALHVLPLMGGLAIMVPAQPRPVPASRA